MIFTYTYRNRSGALEQCSMEAASRSEAMQKLTLKGVCVISLTVNGVSRKFVSRKVLCVSGVLAILICIMGAWLIWARNSCSETLKRVEKAREHEAPGNMILRKGEAPIVAVTHRDANAREPQRSSTNEPSRIVHQRRGKTPKVIVLGPTNVTTNVKESTSLFDNETDALLSLYTEPGKDIPPPPPSFGEIDDKAILNRPIQVTEEDSETDVMKKATVAEMREELKAFLDAGGTMGAYFEELAARQRSEVAIAEDTRRMVMELAAEGKIAEAAAMADAVDAYRAERGLGPVQIPPKYRAAVNAARKETK